jgi:acyl-CoA thioester hydrolase
VAVHCKIATVRRSSFRVEFEMRVGTKLVAEGYGVLVGFDYVAEKAAVLPEKLTRRLEDEVAAQAQA